MADLKTVESRIAELKAEIEPTLREIETLEATARVLRALDKGEPVTHQPPRSFSELTMPEAAKQILLEHVERSLHYKDIAQRALERGFKGKRIKAGSGQDQIAASFRRMMAQDKKVFQPMGRGYFKISDEYLERKD